MTDRPRHRRLGPSTTPAWPGVVGACLLVLAGLAAALLSWPGLADEPAGWQHRAGAAGAPASSTRAWSALASSAPASSAPVEPRAEVGSRWESVLAALGARRARAWQVGEPRLLGAVYAAGSSALMRDREMLREYVVRGLDVRGAAVAFGPVEVLSHRPGRARLRVVDRLGPTVVHDAAGRAQVLPRDRPTAHLITLERSDGGWRISSVRPAG